MLNMGSDNRSTPNPSALHPTPFLCHFCLIKQRVCFVTCNGCLVRWHREVPSKSVYSPLCLSPFIHPEEEKKKKVVRLPVQRSVETGLAIEFKSRFTRQPSRDPDAEDPKPGALIFPGVKLATDKQFTGFLEGLGPAQLAGRQTLATPPMGDIQIGMVYRKERLDVEVIRARGLVGKQGNKNTPAPYVKVYLMDNGKCVLKRRTRLARKTLDPLYQQQLQFEENPEGKLLQVSCQSNTGWTRPHKQQPIR
uniref:C2 domain-containing protein n=1 Tax=Amphiprion percula TaxID=161767 RepID=A0A3P8RPH7_AMPPE